MRTLIATLALLLLSDLATVPRLASAQTSELARLLASDRQPGDRFGTSLATSGGTAVVGAPFGGNAAAGSTGAAYIYRFDGLIWAEEVKLLASDGQIGDDFGRAVAISGDVVVVGIPNISDSSRSGAAYVFRYDGTAWIEEQKLTPSDGPQSPNSFFGGRVAAFGDTVVIGAHRDNENGEGAGAAYVFRFDGAAWLEEAKLLASNGQEEDEFGFSVAVFGDTVVVGTVIDRPAPGTAYIYRFDGTNWMEELELQSSDLQDGDRFGWSVAVSGGTSVLGAPNFNDARGDSVGAAYVYRFDGTSWNAEAKLTASDGVAIDRFGDWVAISGDTLAVGTKQADNEAGAAYLYRFNGAAWPEVAKLVASDRASLDSFGVVSVFGDDVLVGAPMAEDDLGVTTGSAYVFRATLVDCLPCEFGDADMDGEGDSTDECPATIQGLEVDQSGCSQQEFCASITGRLACWFADWRNDEPLPGQARDCGFDRKLRRCVAR